MFLTCWHFSCIVQTKVLQLFVFLINDLPVGQHMDHSAFTLATIWLSNTGQPVKKSTTQVPKNSPRLTAMSIKDKPCSCRTFHCLNHLSQIA